MSTGAVARANNLRDVASIESRSNVSVLARPTNLRGEQKKGVRHVGDRAHRTRLTNSIPGSPVPRSQLHASSKVSPRFEFTEPRVTSPSLRFLRSIESRHLGTEHVVDGSIAADLQRFKEARRARQLVRGDNRTRGEAVSELERVDTHDPNTHQHGTYERNDKKDEHRHVKVQEEIEPSRICREQQETSKGLTSRVEDGKGKNDEQIEEHVYGESDGNQNEQEQQQNLVSTLEGLAELDFGEIETGANDTDMPENEHRSSLREIFFQLDMNGDGLVNRRELIISLRRDEDDLLHQLIGLSPGERVSQESSARTKVELIFQAIDEDGSDDISYDEFRRYFEDRRHMFSSEASGQDEGKGDTCGNREEPVTEQDQKATEEEEASAADVNEVGDIEEEQGRLDEESGAAAATTAGGVAVVSSNWVSYFDQHHQACQ